MNCREEKDHYAHANRLFLEEISRKQHGTPHILDVGCWGGSLGQQVKGGCDCIFDGIEINHEMADRAKALGYRSVLVQDLNDPESLDVSELYDFICMGDVLEHLIDPARVLREMRKNLLPNGRLLVSLPNIAFVLNRFTHLLGRWDYADHGILDRTHLRFFTKSTMRSLIESSGYRIVSMRGHVGLYGYPWIVREGARFLSVLWPSLFAIQIVIVAVLNDVDDFAGN